MFFPIIGLEIHAHLKTRTKMFCACLNDPDEIKPNTNICPVCTGQPGALPVPNKQAIERVLRLGLALNGDLPIFSKFDRKNYFYPDLPKGYQISQYDLPLISHAVLNGIRVRRIHLEEDAGRLQHTENGSLVDFNRAGTPLMELVTEPDIKSAEEAAEFARELRLVLRYLDASDADMEKGQMRVEVNISMNTREGLKNFQETSGQSGAEASLGTKVEVKNINSFTAASSAIEYEIQRQTRLLEAGDGRKIVQETRGWDEINQATVSQRGKEEAHDYRYFPEPDIPPLDMSLFDLKRLQSEITELPQAKRTRFKKEYGLPEDAIELLVGDKMAAGFFEEVASELTADQSEKNERPIQLAGNYINADLRGLMIERAASFADLKITPKDFAHLIELVVQNKVSSRAAKDILKTMFEAGGDPHAILKDKGLAQVSDQAALQPLVKKIIAANPQAVADYKKGKTSAVMFLVGRAMAELKGAGNPQVLNELFKRTLAAPEQ